MSLNSQDLDVAGERDACVVVDLVDGAVVLVDRFGVRLKCLALGNVQPVGLHRRADGLQPLLGHREALGVDVADRQLGAGAPELDRKGLADPGPGARHDGDFPCEAVHLRTPSCQLTRNEASRYPRSRVMGPRPVIYSL